MSDKAKEEFSLDQFSQAETDEEFGLPEFKEHFADTLTPAVLRDWTAKDFASIYVRFRPHLERHAKRFLVNPSQVEEVVQDAFLYLMTTLPELDSELGVLKFLKWKVRLLSLDVIRANSRASISPLEELPDIESDEPETSQGLERAEDAAIVSMALAKLQPRQREALIATLYEEKSTEVVASQMGLSENAFRQLLFRARSSFKKALVGEAETAGLSVSQILSLAAKKASSPTPGAIGLVLMISVSILPLLGETTPLSVSQAEVIAKSENFRNPSPNEGSEVSGNSDQSRLTPEIAAATGSRRFDSGSNYEQARAQNKSIADSKATSDEPQMVANELPNTAEETEISRLLLETSLDRNRVSALISHLRTTAATHDYISERTIRVEYPDVSAFIVLGEQTEDPVQFVYLKIRTGGAELTAVPLTLVTVRNFDLDQTSTLELAMTDLIIGDLTGHFDNVTVSESSLSRSYTTVTLSFGTSGQLEDAMVNLDHGSNLDI